MRPARLAIALAVLTGALAVAGASSGAPRTGARPAAARTPALNDSNRVLVRIGRETITRGDVQRRLDELPEQVRANYSTPEGRQQLVDRMVEEKVWLMTAMKQGVAERPQVRRQIEQQRRDLVIRTYLNEVMASNPTPSDSEARAYYDEHLSDYRVPASAVLRHIQTKTQADAKRVLQWARAKQDWNKLVQRFSTDTLTRASGGSLGTVTREGVFVSIGTQPALAESAFALGEGRIGGPWKTDRGWHVVKVESLKPESTRPFEQLRSTIVRQLGSQRAQEFYKSRLEGARKSLGVAPDSAAIKGFLSQRKSPRDLFREAQDAGPAEKRIELYRKLLGEYPDSDVSPQAQFMVGFIYSEELKKYDEAEKSFRDLLSRYPRSELAPSAQWMVDHMRSEEAPSFINLEPDSSRQGAARSRPRRGASRKP